MSSKAFEEFQRRYFEDRDLYYDGIPTYLLLELEGDERVEAENQLLANLESRNFSDRAIIGLGVMRCQRASALLKELLLKLNHDDSGRFEIARALWRIEKFPDAIEEFSKILCKPVDPKEYDWSSGRNCVAFALREVRTIESVKLLIRALDDPDNIVRSHAAESLGIMCGPFPLINTYSFDLYSEDPEKREKGKRAIWELINPEIPPAPLMDGYSIYFDWPNYEYLHYCDKLAGKQKFTFHIVYAERYFLVRTGNYLSEEGWGEQMEFAEGEKERIVPRLRRFFEDQRLLARFIDAKHEQETNIPRRRSVPMRMLPKKDEVSMREAVLNKAMLNNYLERIEVINDSEKKTPKLHLILVGVIGGAIGAGIGTFIYLQGNSSFLIPWICALLLGVIIFWLRHQ